MDNEFRWIPVTESLPAEDDGTVAVLTDDDQVLTARATYWYGARNDFVCWTFLHVDEDIIVTHWLRLPHALGAQ